MENWQVITWLSNTVFISWYMLLSLSMQHGYFCQSVKWGLQNKSQPLSSLGARSTLKMEAVCWEQVCIQYICILHHSSLGFICKELRRKLLSNWKFCGISHMQGNNFQKSRFNCILFYSTLSSLEVLSLDKETDKAMKWWVCILDWIFEIILSLPAHMLVQTLPPFVKGRAVCSVSAFGYLLALTS